MKWKIWLQSLLILVLLLGLTQRRAARCKEQVPAMQAPGAQPGQADPQFAPFDRALW